MILTCEQIVGQVRAMGLPVTRTTYREIAERIHPRVRQPVFGKPDDRDPRDDPEWCEYYRGQRIGSTGDWTDLVVHAVTLWQWYAAYQARVELDRLALELIRRQK